MVGSFVFLTQATRVLPIGTAYAVWTGTGAAGTAIMGMALLGEPVTPARIFCLSLVLAGIVGLRLVTSHE